MERIRPRFVSVELYFENLERAKEFYIETMGLEVSDEQIGHHAKFEIGMPLGPPLIYFLQNCCLFFTGLLDEGYVLDARQGPPIVEERRVRRQAGDLGRQKKNGSVSSYQTGAASQASGSGSVSDYATWQVEFNR